MDKMRILIIADEVWNDELFGNNVLSNWFDGFDAEFASVYCSPGRPLNKLCRKYFQLTETMMVKSLFSDTKAGIPFNLTYNQMNDNDALFEDNKNEKIYKFMKSISGEPVRLIRDIIWQLGRYDKEKLKTFVQNFNPDVVFCPRLLTPKLIRIEKLVSSFTNAPFVAFTGDDEESLNQRSYNPLFWLRRLYMHHKFNSHVKLYSYYFMHSGLQAEKYKLQYNVETGILFKSGEFNDIIPKKVNTPIKLIYAGRLYCNRWKILTQVATALHEINTDKTKMILDIYTQDKISKKQKKLLNDGKSVFFKGAVRPSELKNIYLKSDIALHVESMDVTNRLITKYSFSTKIIDLLGGSCAVMAIAWEKQTGFTHLKQNDAAFCISDVSAIKSELLRIVNNPVLINEYTQKALECGKQNHRKEQIQTQIMSVFETLIKDKSAVC